MASIIFTLGANSKPAQEEIAKLKKDLESIKKIKINPGISEKEMSALTKLTNAQAKLVSANAKLAAETNKLKLAETELRIAREKTKQVTKEQEELTRRATEATKRATEATNKAKEATKQQREETKQAAEATKQAAEATKQAAEKTAQAAEKTAQAEQKKNEALAKAEAAASKAQEKETQLAIARERNVTAAKSHAAATEEETGKLSKLFAKFGSGVEPMLKNFASTLRSRISSAIIGAVTSATSQAIQEMKAVDTQLTNIQKVSQMTDEEIKRIGKSAYATASQYGVSADEYLSAVYTFQKAGLGDSAEKMAELATKTMLVGDTTATVASKFLIAANAAWEFNGDIAQLSKVVDEADYINNNYATDLAKLSAGMPIVASTAANMGMSLEETMAVLGTITAVTQESGTKAATAWRALSMNLAGEIGTFLTEDGEEIEVTAESIKSVTDALAKYAPEAVEAAKATGKMIDPIKAVESLARAYKEGQINDIDLTNILMGVGGKLRTNQLTALVKNFDLYEEMLGRLGDAAGTADAEISTMLGSWESKTQILKNTWTEFISNLVDSDMVKTGIDIITNAIDGLDSSIGRTIIVVGGLVAAFAALGPVGSILVAAAAAVGLIVDKVKESSAVYTENTEALRNMEKAYSDANKKLYDTQNELRATGDLTKEYINSLKHLQRGTDDYHDTLERIVRLMPELGEYIDLENDKILVSVDSLFLKADAWVKEAEAAAYSAAIGTKAQALAEAELEAKKAENRKKDAEEDKRLIDDKIAYLQKEQQALIDMASETDGFGNSIFYEDNLSAEQRQRYNEIFQELSDLYEEQASKQDEIDQLTEAWEEHNEKIKEATDALEEEKRAYEDLTGQKPGGEKEPESQSKSSAREKVRAAETQQKAAEASAKAEAEAAQSAREKAEAEEAYASAAERGAQANSGASTGRNAGTSSGATVSGDGGALANAEAEATAKIKTALEERQKAYEENRANVQKSYEESVNDAKNFGSEIVSAINGEVSAGASTAAAAGIRMGKAIGDGIISQSAYIKQKISQTFTIAKMFIDNLAANGAVSYHPSGQSWYIDRNGVRQSYASGTSNAAGGETLVNELGPELINDNGKVFIANGGEPAVVNLSKGAIVLTAEQTAEAMRGANSVPKQGAAQAMNVNNLAEATRVVGKATKLPSNFTSGIANVIAKIDRLTGKRSGGGGSGSGSGGSGGGSAATPSAEETLSNLESQLDDILKKIDLQVKLAENEGDYPRMADLWEQAQEEIAKMVDAYRKAGYADDSPEILELLNKNYDYANKQLKLYQDKWDDLVDALEAQTDATKLANQLAEKQQAAEEAREALANAQKQRTVRIYNAATGQWEWIADESKTKSAQETLTKAEESYADEVKSQAIKELQSMRDTIVDLNDVVLGPALSAVATMAQSSSEFQAFAQALNAVFGVGSYLTGTEGSTKVIPTTDSHNTVYSFGDLVLTEEQASTMTLKQLAEQLQVLKIS